MTTSVREEPLGAIFKVYEDAEFLTGESPAILDVNADLGRDGRSTIIICDGAGDLKVATSDDGDRYSDDWTMKAQEVYNVQDVCINKIRITWVANSAYRVQVI